jgi:hypothetical protein
MSDKAKPKRAQRSARTPGDSAAIKAERLRGSLSNALKKVAKEPIAPARTSAALLALRPRAKEIVEALERGWSANAIAEAIATEAGDGVTFSTETIRTAVKRIAEEARMAARPIEAAIKKSASLSPDVDPIRSVKNSTTTESYSAEDP